MQNEFNFIHESLPETDLDLFFGPIEENEVFTKISDSITWADILVTAGIFKSKSEARKNIPTIKGISNLKINDGWNAIVVGKKKIKIHVLNKF